MNKRLTVKIFAVKVTLLGRGGRIEFKSALCHILSRGNEQKDIFYDDQDRQLFLRTIGVMSERFKVDVFCLCVDGKKRG